VSMLRIGPSHQANSKQAGDCRCCCGNAAATFAFPGLGSINFRYPDHAVRVFDAARAACTG
jgi:hypothetical protein